MKSSHKIGLLSATTILGVHIFRRNRYRKESSLPNRIDNEENLFEEEVLEGIHWVKGENYQQQMDDTVVPYLVKYRTQGVYQNESQSLWYDHYLPKNPQATLLIIHGFNEYKEKYWEFIYYLLQSNIEVFVLDLRGHGFSREDDHQTRIHVDNFNQYIEDIEGFVDDIVIPNSHTQRLRLYGHSMGGAIATSFVESHKTPFDRVILHAPMLSINIGKQDPVILLDFLKLISSLNLSQLPIPTLDKFDPVKSSPFFPDNNVAKNSTRSHYYHQLNFQLHQNPTRGGSLGWLLSSLKQTQKITRPRAIQSITQDVLIVRAQDDFIVNKEGVFALVKYGRHVESVVVDQAYHEIFAEEDSIIRPYYSRIINFITK